MIQRELASRLIALFSQYPFVTVTGPRQSGKTTLCRTTFPNLDYVNLEQTSEREFAKTDPEGFIARFAAGAIIDEVQRVPDLLSNLQVYADEIKRNSLFVLTGSENFALSQAVSQSLAGRTALLSLLPLNITELEQSGIQRSLTELLFTGFFPRLYDQPLDPSQALGDYFATYVERDIGLLGGVGNLPKFEQFAKLCAGRVGTLTDFSSLAKDTGVTHTTARNWIGVLERSYVVFRLQPYFSNMGKRLVKTPKLYFYDVGLASHLIGIEGPDQIETHPLKGALFENMVVVEAMKHRFNRSQIANLSFFRDNHGLECDLLIETNGRWIAVEIKSSATMANDAFRNFTRVEKSLDAVDLKAVVYGGSVRQSRRAGEVVPYNEFTDMLDLYDVRKSIQQLPRKPVAEEKFESVISILDVALHKFIRPTVFGLRGQLDKVSKFFKQRDESPVFTIGEDHKTAVHWLIPDSWEKWKIDFPDELNVELSDGKSLHYKHNMVWFEHELPNASDFRIEIICEWAFGTACMTRTITINERELDDPGPVTVEYDEFVTQSARVDRTCNAVLRQITQLIDTQISISN